MKTAIAIVLALGLASIAQAQISANHSLPAGYDAADGNYATTQPFNVGPPLNPGQRWQFIYDWTTLYHQCPITVYQIGLRPNNDAAVVTGGTLMNCTIVMASSLTDHLNPDPFFANNLDPADMTTVYQGQITIPPYTGPALGVPAPFILQIPFQSFFFFDATRQKDLIIDITIPNCAFTAFTIDGVFPTNYAGRFGHDSDPNSAFWNFGNADAAPIFELTYFLGSPVHFELLAFTTTGTGDLGITFNNVPATTTSGYTLVSLTPAAEFGRGPVFGLQPDLVTFDVLLRPAAPGDPLHWTWPVSPPLFPAMPLILPPGTVSPFFYGQTWEVVGIALNALGQIDGVTAPSPLNW